MCSIATHISANALEFAIHDVCVDVAQRRMQEGSGEAADNLKAKTLPQPDRALIGTDHEVELHRAKSALPRSVQRMRAHCSGHAAARRCNGCHVAAVGNVPAATLLIGLQKISADHTAVDFRNKYFMRLT